MKTKTDERPKCARCGQRTPLALGVRAGKPQVPLCGDCQLRWFQQRDKLVVEAFEAYIAEGAA